MSRAAAPLEVPNIHRRALEDIARSRALPTQQIRRARALLLAADGLSNVEIAGRCGVTPRTVSLWRARFQDAGVETVRWDRRGRTPPAEISPELVRSLAVAPVAVIGLYLGASQRAVTVTVRKTTISGGLGPATAVGSRASGRDGDSELVELAMRHDLVLVESPDSAHRDLLTFLKAVEHGAHEGERIVLLLDRWSGPMEHYEVDRWLAHPRRQRFDLRLVHSTDAWRRLVAGWLRTDRSCAAVAPRQPR